MKLTATLWTLGWVVLAGGAIAAGPDPACSSFRAEVPIDSSVASSKLWANVTGREESVRVQSKRLLDDAENGAAAVRPPEGLCPSYCRAPAQPQIVFSTTPTDFLSRYDQQDKCERLLRTTSQAPLSFDTLTFESIEQLNDWVQDFTRGKGPQGQELYRRCDGKCSPQYLWTISPAGEKLMLETEVTCGHARDKEISRYRLSAAYRWVCDEP